MKTLLIDNGSTLTDKLAKLSPGEEFVCTWDTIPDDYNEYSLIILSGSSKFPVVGNELKLKKEIELIQNTTVPIVGVCLGHELLAYAFGAVIEDLEKQHHGMAEVFVTDNHSMFGDKEVFTVYENHRYGIIDIGENLVELARTNYSVAVVKHKTKPIFGFQFHPEHHTDEQFGDEVFLRLFEELVNIGDIGTLSL